MIKKFVEKNFRLEEVLKENISLMFDKKNRRLCIMKKIRAESVEIYLRLKKIQNPHVPKIYHVFENFVVEEYITGKTFSEILDGEKNLSDEKIISLLIQLCQCLKILHENEIIHRDIKPSNLILADDGNLKFIDFGIARQVKKNSCTDTEWLGTRGYAPPEQFGFAQTDARSDIYALGATFQLFRPKSSLLQKIIHKATNFNPNERYQNADEILAELQQKNNFFYSLKNLFRKNFDERDLEEILQEKLLSFKISLPDVEDYYFRRKNYCLEKKLNYPGDYEYIFDDEKTAFIAGVLSFDENIYSKLDEYIQKVWAMYEERQLKNFLIYEVSQENFYHRTNLAVERQIEKIFSRFGLKKIPKNLIEFNFIPALEKINFDYVKEIREQIDLLHNAEGVAAYADYVETRQTVMRNAPKKFAFHTDKAVDAFFGDIFWATEFFTKISDDFRETLQNIIRNSYQEKFREALKIKSAQIKKFVVPRLTKMLSTLVAFGLGIVSSIIGNFVYEKLFKR